MIVLRAQQWQDVVGEVKLTVHTRRREDDAAALRGS